MWEYCYSTWMMQVYHTLPPTSLPRLLPNTQSMETSHYSTVCWDSSLNSSTEGTIVRGVPDCAITTTKKMNYPEPATKLFDMHEPFSLLKSPTGSVTFFYQSILNTLSLIYLFINPFNDVFVFNLFAIWSQLWEQGKCVRPHLLPDNSCWNKISCQYIRCISKLYRHWEI